MSSTISSPSVVVIGGGISGLTTGFLLNQKGFNVTLFEKKESPGGVIRSIEDDGWLVEWGPNTIMANHEKLWDLIENLDLNDQVIQPEGNAAKRYIVKNGKPTPLPDSLLEFIKTGLLSTGAKFRLFKEPFISKSGQPESIADFIKRRLGKEVVDYAVNPFIAGVYAGDPKQLSVKHTLSRLYELEQEFGSIVKGAVKSAGKSKTKSRSNKKGLISFKKGIQQLPLSLSKKVESSIRYNSMVTEIKSKTGRWQVACEGTAPADQYDAVIYTAPLHQLSTITTEIAQAKLLSELESLRYAPIATISLGFKRDQIQHSLDGFGMLVPEVESFNILGCLFSSSLFRGRAPEGHVLLTCFVGGARNPAHVDLSDEEIKKIVIKDLRQLLGCKGDPVFKHLHRWKKAIPQYEMDYDACLDAIDTVEEHNPGLFFTGNFRNEVSVPGCIQNSYETADRAASFLQS